VVGTSISIRVYSWVQLVGNVGVVWSGIGGGSVGGSGTWLMLRSESSGGVSVGGTKTSRTSVPVRVDTGIKLVCNVGVMRTGGIGG